MNMPVIILGSGGHAKVLINTLQSSFQAIAGIVDLDPALAGTKFCDVPVLGDDNVINGFRPSCIRLVIGIGSIGLPGRREQLYERYKLLGYSFATVVHPSAIVASDSIIGEGTQVMAGAVIQPGCNIGANCIINTSSSVDHDCIIGDHVHIAPGVTLSGGVNVNERVHIGTGATVIQGISVGRASLIAAGAVVTRNVIAETMVRGVPAREFA